MITSPKIEPRHLRLRALVYVRQSTPQQLQHNQESTRRQYALRDKALALGWASEQIHVIESESFFEQPESTYAGVLDFLDLPPAMPDRFDRWNGRPSSPMTPETRARLREHFLSHDRALAEILGREPAWLL